MKKPATSGGPFARTIIQYRVDTFCGCGRELRRARKGRLWPVLRAILFNIAGALLTIALAGESFFSPALFTRFQVKRVPFDFLYDVFLLNLAFKTPQGAFQSLAILQMDFCQKRFTTFQGSAPKA
jgi:hypothetical protein